MINLAPSGCSRCIVPIARTVTRRLCKRSRAYQQNTVIVGAGEIGQLIARKLIKHPEYGANVVGFVDRRPGFGAPICPSTSGSWAGRTGCRRSSRRSTSSGS